MIGVILLAAGASVRFGAPKQLLPFRGETLLRRSARAALAVSEKTVVTLGANAATMRREIADLSVQIAENKDWAAGMSGSLKIGLEKLLETDADLDGALVMVCDQPLVDEKLLRKIIEIFLESDALIVACEYADTLGVPALFPRKLFPELLALDARAGAKNLIEKYAAQTAAVSFPEGAFDVDTRADYENLLRGLS